MGKRKEEKIEEAKREMERKRRKEEKGKIKGRRRRRRREKGKENKYVSKQNINLML